MLKMNKILPCSHCKPLVNTSFNICMTMFNSLVTRTWSRAFSHGCNLKARRPRVSPRRVQDEERSDEEIQHNNEGSEIEHLMAQSVQDSIQNKLEFPSDLTMEKQRLKSFQCSQEKHALRPNIDPQETSILLFPGQGSQFVGMGKRLLPYPNVEEMYKIASGILGYDLLDLCMNGPKSELDKTVFCQPAVFVTSLAAVERLREENPTAIDNCISTSGFSVGEYAALVFAGVLTFEEGLELIKARGKAMQHASEITPSGMMSVFLNRESKVKFACHVARMYCKEKLHIEQPVCNVANYLYTECKVIAGNIEALDFIEENKKDFGLGRIKRLPVSGAFHTELMKPAAHKMKNIISKTEFRKPIIPVHSNVDGLRHDKSYRLKKLLIEQLYKPVKWEQIMHVLYSRKQGLSFPNTYEVGPGNQLRTLLKMTNNVAYQFCRNVEV